MAERIEKHTPGPWEAETRACVGSPDWQVTSGRLVVAVVSGGGDLRGAGRRNALLLAAAPELLEAARDALALLVDFRQERSSMRPRLRDDKEEDPPSPVEAALALAIAKATE